MTDRIYGMLGLAVRAGKVIFGSEASADAARGGRAYLAVLASDASDRTKKLIKNKCESFGVPLYEYGVIAELSAALGKKRVSCVAVRDRGFAEAIIKMLN